MRWYDGRNSRPDKSLRIFYIRVSLVIERTMGKWCLAWARHLNNFRRVDKIVNIFYVQKFYPQWHWLPLKSKLISQLVWLCVCFILLQSMCVSTAQVLVAAKYGNSVGYLKWLHSYEPSICLFDHSAYYYYFFFNARKCI